MTPYCQGAQDAAVALSKRGEFKWLLHTKNAWNGKIPVLHQEIQISDDFLWGNR